jgi:hypothetical protein
MISMSESALRNMVLTNTPVGMNQTNVEQVISKTFCKKWVVIDYDAPELISKLGFSVPVSKGDY